MFAYCLNNPVVCADETGAAARVCISADGRIADAPWREHSPSGGGRPFKNYSSGSNYYGEVADKFYSVKFFKAAGSGLKKGVKFMWRLHVHSVELSIQQQIQNDYTIIKTVEFFKENPAMAIDIAFITVGVFSLAITTVSTIVAIPVPAALSTVLNTINNTGVVWSVYRTCTGVFDAWANYIEGE